MTGTGGRRLAGDGGFRSGTAEGVPARNSAHRMRSLYYYRPMKRIPLYLAVAAILAGCASGPSFKSAKAPDNACVEGDVANFFKFFTSGEAHVSLREIDGLPTEGNRASKFCFAPGQHRLGIRGYNNLESAQDYVDLNFAPGRMYQIKGNLRGISIVFRMYDVTTGEEVPVSEFSIKAGATQNMPIPVFVPAR